MVVGGYLLNGWRTGKAKAKARRRRRCGNHSSQLGTPIRLPRFDLLLLLLLLWPRRRNRHHHHHPRLLRVRIRTDGPARACTTSLLRRRHRRRRLRWGARSRPSRPSSITVSRTSSRRLWLRRLRLRSRRRSLLRSHRSVNFASAPAISPRRRRRRRRLLPPWGDLSLLRVSLRFGTTTTLCLRFQAMTPPRSHPPERRHSRPSRRPSRRPNRIATSGTRR